MQKITVVMNNNAEFIPSNIYDKKLAFDSLKVGKPYQCKLTNARILKHNSKYWLLLNALEFHTENNSAAWHLFFKSKFLPMVEFSFPSGKKILYPNSTAFDKMGQVEFDEYYKKVELFLNEKGYNIDDLINYS